MRHRIFGAVRKQVAAQLTRGRARGERSAGRVGRRVCWFIVVTMLVVWVASAGTLAQECPTCPPRFLIPELVQSCSNGSEFACRALGQSGARPAYPGLPYLRELVEGGGGSPVPCTCLLCVCFYRLEECPDPVQEPLPGGDPGGGEPGGDPEPGGGGGDPGCCGNGPTVIAVAGSCVAPCNPCADAAPCVSAWLISCYIRPLPCFDSDGDGECDYTEDDDGDDVKDINDTIDGICGSSESEACQELRAQLGDNDSDGIPNFLDALANGPNGPLSEGILPHDPADIYDYIRNGTLNGQQIGELVSRETFIAVFEGVANGLEPTEPLFLSQMFSFGMQRMLDLIATATASVSGRISFEGLEAAFNAFEAALTTMEVLVSLGEVTEGALAEAVLAFVLETIPFIEGLRSVLENLEEEVNRARSRFLALITAENPSASEITAFLGEHRHFTPLLRTLWEITTGERELAQSIREAEAQLAELVTAAELSEPYFSGPDPEIISYTGDPVNTANGSFVYQQTDAVIRGYPGSRFSFEITRHYSSRTIDRGSLANWRVTGLDDRLVMPLDGAPIALYYLRANGTRQSYIMTPEPEARWIGVQGAFGTVRQIPPDPGEPMQLTPVGYECDLPPGGFILRQPSGMLHVFCPPSLSSGSPSFLSCWLHAIIAPTGEQIRFSRNSLGRVTSIVGPRGEQYSFHYEEERPLLTRFVLPDESEILFEYSDPYNGDYHDVPNEEVAQALRGALPYLLAVHSPESSYLNEEGVVSRGSSTERYTYHPDLHAENNHFLNVLSDRLHTISRNEGAPIVTLDYFVNDRNYENGRVKSHVVDGKIIEYEYVFLDGLGPDVYGQTPDHVTVETTAEGLIRRFYHSQGILVRKETQEPGADDSFVTLFDYDEDWLLLSRTETTVNTYPSAQRKTEWVYDSSNPSRFSAANVLEVRVNGDPASGPENGAIVTRYSYEPITNQVRSVTDPNNYTTDFVFEYQEVARQEIEATFGVAGWILDLDSMTFSIGDQNGNGALGTSTGPSGRSWARANVARQIAPPAIVSTSAGPGSEQSVRAFEQFVYTEIGQVRRYVDAAGVVSELVYHQGVPETVVIDVGGAALHQQLVHDERGRVIRRVDPRGYAVDLGYDVRDNLVQVIQRAGVVGANGDPPAVADPHADPGPDDIVMRYHYDKENRYSGSEGPLAGEVIPYVVGAVPRLNERRQYTAAGFVSALERRTYRGAAIHATATWQVQYDSQGRESCIVRPSGASVLISRNWRGDILAEQQVSVAGIVLGESTREYNQYGDLTAVRSAEDADGDGQQDTTLFFPDGYGRGWLTLLGDGRLLSQTLDLGSRVVQLDVYSPSMQLLAQQVRLFDSDGSVLETWDANLALRTGGGVELQSPSYLARKTGYDMNRRVVWTQSDPGGANLLKRHEYDTVGRLRKTHGGTGGEVFREWVYDGVGQLNHTIVQHDSSGRGPDDPSPSQTTTSYLYSALHGRLGRIEGPDGSVRIVEYSPQGRVSRLTDSLGNSRAFLHDSMGQMIEFEETGNDVPSRTLLFDFNGEAQVTLFEDANGRTTTFEYDDWGRRQGKVLQDGSRVELSYDLEGRLTSEQHRDAQGAITRDVVRQYDRVGRLAQLDATGLGPSVHRTIEYDGNDNVSSILEHVEGVSTVTIEREWSSVGAMLSDLQTIGAEVSSPFSVVHDGAVRRLSLTYPSGKQLDHEYDAVGRLEVLTYLGPTDPIYQQQTPYGFRGPRVSNLRGNGSLEREWRADGRIIQQDLEWAGVPVEALSYEYDSEGNLLQRARGNRTESFSYDGFHRLAEAEFPVGSRSLAWEYDPADNIVSVTDSVFGNSTGSVNALNQLTSFGSFSSITYDPDGQEASRTAPASTVTSTWDAMGRLSTRVEGGVTHQYIYDGLGRLVRTVSSGDESVSYRSFGNQVLRRETSTGWTEYVYGPHGIWAERSNGASAYLLSDPFRNVIGEYSESGTVVDQWEFDPFGTPRDATGNELDATFLDDRPGWLQCFLDPAGLYRMRHRHFDPGLGRFISRDPIGLAGGPNLYAYGLANPYRWGDPSGLKPEELSEPGPGIEESSWAREVEHWFAVVLPEPEVPVLYRARFDEQYFDESSVLPAVPLLASTGQVPSRANQERTARHNAGAALRGLGIGVKGFGYFGGSVIIAGQSASSLLDHNGATMVDASLRWREWEPQFRALARVGAVGDRLSIAGHLVQGNLREVIRGLVGIAGGAIGGAVGTTITPGVGTFVGGIAGGELATALADVVLDVTGLGAALDAIGDFWDAWF